LEFFTKFSTLTEDQIHSVWLSYDTDKNGILTKQEFTQFVKDLVALSGETWTDVYSEELLPGLITKFDSNNDGKITWSEFLNSFKSVWHS